MRTPPALTRFGRLRSVTNLPNGDLVVTTSNGDGKDSVLRVHPNRLRSQPQPSWLLPITMVGSHTRKPTSGR